MEQADDTEHLIVMARGNPPWAVPGEQWDTSFDAPAIGHSIKPDEPYDFLMQQFPASPKLEMFARKQRDGWNAWGDEVDALTQGGGLLGRPIYTMGRNERTPSARTSHEA